LEDKKTISTSGWYGREMKRGKRKSESERERERGIGERKE